MKKEITRITEKLLILKKNNAYKLEYINGYIDAKLEKKKRN
ncbi:Uncharacterised protein [[Clostridium] sordellii]|jgi:hypothetical protein|nr:hypothetical protein [Paeniclostridium sordellii]DAU04087.1 MAG TPA: hypothetical protein [Caudoviricetes sp.]CEN23176.1 Uncharacterised protein [[Clostridium] sordellii] [Paeniclostridium sordellii]CEN24194.1 Uncharacterised protein [[Clostridium] sordellii] [Paeniclostridium sordellii]CEN26228.1 Uncharacterised protein [[Clostridium] sordellii] [Paeniclostridium sordellii]CEP50423.1 Uncharacterised protein [[Clostridium] sordellii] [Paeniclostridium sordellii]